jgi:hypothetical protein
MRGAGTGFPVWQEKNFKVFYRALVSIFLWITEKLRVKRTEIGLNVENSRTPSLHEKLPIQRQPQIRTPLHH